VVSGENTGNQSGVGRDPKSVRASHRSTVAERITRPNQSPPEEFLSFSGGCGISELLDWLNLRHYTKRGMESPAKRP
jgi:hypothetical protein